MNIIAYRLPGAETPLYFEAGEAIDNDQLQAGGHRFIVGPFDNKKPYFSYPLENGIDSIPETCIEQNSLNFAFKETSQEDYYDYIEAIKRSLDGSPQRKIVASRRVKLATNKDINELFSELCYKYPDAFIFFISTKEFGNWIGASPELLLERRFDTLKSMSLAGTRKIGTSEPWDQKNILEQAIVTRIISEVFQSYKIDYKIYPAITKRAGTIEHIMTKIEGSTSAQTDLPSLLKTLSPTPALAGYPKNESMEIISNYEGDRVLYGGFMGPVFPNGNFIFNVILRCGYLTENKDLKEREVVLFGGGGITAYSDAEKEWEETENKLSTLKNFLI